MGSEHRRASIGSQVQILYVPQVPSMIMSVVFEPGISAVTTGSTSKVKPYHSLLCVCTTKRVHKATNHPPHYNVGMGECRVGE